MDNTMDLYAELGVTPQAEPEVIRAAFRALAQRYHPDRQAGASGLWVAKMARINQAYSVLSQPERRRAYDLSRYASPVPRFVRPLIHITTTQASVRNAQPFLTTYDARGRLHAFV
jgi:curved DNA-binding protein CbpA